MNFTYSQCRRFKEWGYPQEGADFFLDNLGRVQSQPVPYGDGTSTAIPTLDGVMVWLGKEIDATCDTWHIWLHRRHDCDEWDARIDNCNTLKDVNDILYRAQGPTAHAALYNLAEKVKGGKDA